MHRYDLSPASLLLALQHVRLPSQQPQLVVQPLLLAVWSHCSRSNLFFSLSSLYCSMSCLICSLSSLSYYLYSLFNSFIWGKFWAKISFILRRVPSFRYISIFVPISLTIFVSFRFVSHSLLVRFDAKQSKKKTSFRKQKQFNFLFVNFTLNRKRMAHPMNSRRIGDISLLSCNLNDCKTGLCNKTRQERNGRDWSRKSTFKTVGKLVLDK